MQTWKKLKLFRQQIFRSKFPKSKPLSRMFKFPPISSNFLLAPSRLLGCFCMSEINIYPCNNKQKMVSNIVLQSQHFIFPLNHALSQKIMRSPELRIFFAALLWEACKIQNRLNRHFFLFCGCGDFADTCNNE